MSLARLALNCPPLFRNWLTPRLAVHRPKLVAIAFAARGRRRIREELRAERVAGARQAQRGQVQGLLGRLVAAAGPYRQVERLGNRQHAMTGLQPALDQLRRQDSFRFPCRVMGVDGEGIGLAEDLRFVLSNDPIDLLVRRATIMGLGAAKQKQCARQDREKTPGSDGSTQPAQYSGLSFTHRTAGS